MVYHITHVIVFGSAADGRSVRYFETFGVPSVFETFGVPSVYFTVFFVMLQCQQSSRLLLYYPWLEIANLPVERQTNQLYRSIFIKLPPPPTPAIFFFLIRNDFIGKEYQQIFTLLCVSFPLSFYACMVHILGHPLSPTSLLRGDPAPVGLQRSKLHLRAELSTNHLVSEACRGNRKGDAVFHFSHDARVTCRIPGRQVDNGISVDDRRVEQAVATKCLSSSDDPNL